jgi:hypothetical protein
VKFKRIISTENTSSIPVGSETTINWGALSAAILMIAVQALEKHTVELKQNQAQIAVLESKFEELKAEHAYFETVAARLASLPLLVDPVLRRFDAERFSLLFRFRLLARNFQHTGLSTAERRYIDHNSPPAG